MFILRFLADRRLLLGALIVACGLFPVLARWVGAAPASARDGIHATVQKSNGSGVQVSYRADGLARVGQPFAVTLYFAAVTDAEATVRLAADAGLQMSVTEAAIPLSLGTSELALTVTPVADGLAYLNVFTSQNGAGGVTSIPVQTGDAAPRLPSRGELKPSVDGEPPVITFKVP